MDKKEGVIIEVSSPTQNSSNATPSLQPTKPSTSKRRMIIIILVILLIAMVGVSALLFIKYKRAADNNPVSQQQQLIEQLGQVAIVPSEQPVISTVLDRSKLTNKTLARNASNGDKLFIFPKSKRLILYRPSDHKIVDMLTIQG